MADGIDFGKQIGPLPLGAWVVVVGGGLAVAFWNSRQNSGPVEIVEDTSGDEGVGEGPGWVAVPPPDEAPESDIDYQTNEQWGAAAVTWLIGQGYPPGLSNSAINKALAGGVDIEGNKMSIQEWSLWSLALAHLGPPPYPVEVSPPSSTPGPSEPPKDPPKDDPPKPKEPDNRVPPHWTYKAQRNDSLSKISQKYYGTPNKWRSIYKFNLKYRNPATAAIIRARGPHFFYKGSTWWVPKYPDGNWTR